MAAFGFNCRSTASAYWHSSNEYVNGKASIEAIEQAKTTLGCNENRAFGRWRRALLAKAIRQMVTELQNTVTVGGVFVDYVQKIKPEGKFSTRQLAYRQDVSAQLHGIANMHVPAPHWSCGLNW